MTATTTPLKELTLTNFSSLLDKLQLAPLDDWNKCWSLLGCSKHFRRGFADCKVDNIVVIYDNNNNFFDLTLSDKEGVFLFNNNNNNNIILAPLPTQNQHKNGKVLPSSRSSFIYYKISVQ